MATSPEGQLVAKFNDLFGNQIIDDRVKIFVLFARQMFVDSCAESQSRLIKFTNKEKTTVDLDLIGHSHEAAFASRTPGASQYKITINWRHLASNYILAHRMFANPDYRTWVFDEQTQPIRQPLRHLDKDLIEKGVMFAMSPDEKRAAVAEVFAYDAARWLWTHEAAHVELGHFDLQNIFKPSADAGDDDAALSLQALEADADRQAAFRLADIVTDRTRLAKPDEESDAIDKAVYELIYSTRDRIFHWVGLVSAVSIMRFDRTEWTEELMRAKTHPSNFIRIQLMLTALGVHLYKNIGDADSRSANVMQYCERTLLCAAVLHFGAAGMRFDIGGNIISMNVLMRRYDLIVARIAEITQTYAHLLAPAQM